MTVSSSPFGRVSSGLVFIASGANAVGTVVVLILVLVLNSDVISRGMFHHPIRGVHEVVQFSMVLIVFLQLPDVVRNDKLTRSDGLFTVLALRFPGIVTFIGRIIDLLAATIMVIIAVSMWPEFVDAWETNHFFGTPGIFTAPWWPVRLVIILSAILCALIWIAKAVTGQRVLRREAPDPNHGLS
jgi:TRAP-type mannitol/chloroaromatic compound transport system permease small subunit